MKNLNKIEEVEEIEKLINKAEIEMAKSDGQIQSLKNQWKKNYGTDDIDEIKEILKKLKLELSKTQERLEILYEKLFSIHDWEALEKELS